MSTPTPLVVDPVLTAIAVNYRNPDVAFIADQVMPRVPVMSPEFKWTYFPPDQMFTVPDTEVVDTGQLQRGITREAGARSVEVGSNEPCAATHQFGAFIEPLDKSDAAAKLAFFLPNGQFIMVDQVEIPARPFLGFDAGDEADIASTVEAYFGGAFQ
ncbi:phage virion morphogenesis protein [Roseovarius sp. MBR-6]|uniref:phage virion morphogenesis protein n=1 Tax=Roseovarius sp. MBR-6 TaxID=3156459 RepID=UPI003397380E